MAVRCLQAARQERDTRQEDTKATQPRQCLALHAMPSLLQSRILTYPIQVERTLDHTHSLCCRHRRFRYHRLPR